VKAGRECTPQPQEAMRRVREIMECLYNGEFVHCDLALHLFQVQTRLAHIRSVMKRAEAMECLSRLKVMHPPNEGAWPGAVMSKLPRPLEELIAGAELFKVDFFEGGHVKTIASQAYTLMFPCNAFNVRRTIRRAADMILFLDFKKAMTLWFESLRNPGKTMVFEGRAWTSMKEGGVVDQRVEMMSIVFDYEHVITATRVHRYT